MLTSEHWSTFDLNHRHCYVTSISIVQKTQPRAGLWNIPILGFCSALWLPWEGSKGLVTYLSTGASASLILLVALPSGSAKAGWGRPGVWARSLASPLAWGVRDRERAGLNAWRRERQTETDKERQRQRERHADMLGRACAGA